jgi:hypothetical protein
MKETRLLLLMISVCLVLATAVGAAAQEIAISVDHASFCGHDLPQMRKQFAEIGLPTDYGGRHTAVTHMALLGFGDGSYLELIAPQDAQARISEDQKWRTAMLGDAGPCAWAVNVHDVEIEIERLSEVGLEGKGPLEGSRRKPDGTLLQWETGMVGPGEPGSSLPFFIHDKTDRRQRVLPSASLVGSDLQGVGIVVIGVSDLDAVVSRFRKAYGFRVPEIHDEPEFGARVAYFEGTPVMLATPLGASGWLAERLRKFGDKPAAYLLWTSNFRSSSAHFNLVSPMLLARKQVAWFSPSVLGGTRLGVIEK